jgi:hypothetical protein
VDQLVLLDLKEKQDPPDYKAFLDLLDQLVHREPHQQFLDQLDQLDLLEPHQL